MTSAPAAGLRAAASARFWARHKMLNSRRMGSRYVRLRPDYREQLLTSRTRLVIEGFPRSANSFARYAVHVSQGDPQMLAGHNHSVGFVHEAVQAGVPTIVIAREPAGAVASLLQGEPVWPWLAFDVYDSFYRKILEVADRVVFVSFAQVTSDFDGVLQQARERFDIDLAPYDDSEATRAEVARLVEESNRALSGGKVDERWVSRPSEFRRSAAEVLADLTDRDREYLGRAERTYAKVSALFSA